MKNELKEVFKKSLEYVKWILYTVRFIFYGLGLNVIGDILFKYIDITDRLFAHICFAIICFPLLYVCDRYVFKNGKIINEKVI